MPETNAQVIARLDTLLTELRARRAELEAMATNPYPTPPSIVSQQLDIAAELNDLNQQIVNMAIQRGDRQTSEDLQTAVPDLPDADVAIMAAALQAVSESIAAANTFSAAIGLAATIATQAQAATAASSQHEA
jgi:hypothetical protein